MPSILHSTAGSILAQGTTNPPYQYRACNVTLTNPITAGNTLIAVVCRNTVGEAVGQGCQTPSIGAVSDGFNQWRFVAETNNLANSQSVRMTTPWPLGNTYGGGPYTATNHYTAWGCDVWMCENITEESATLNPTPTVRAQSTGFPDTPQAMQIIVFELIGFSGYHLLDTWGYAVPPVTSNDFGINTQYATTQADEYQMAIIAGDLTGVSFTSSYTMRYNNASDLGIWVADNPGSATLAVKGVSVSSTNNGSACGLHVCFKTTGTTTKPYIVQSTYEEPETTDEATTRGWSFPTNPTTGNMLLTVADAADYVRVKDNLGNAWNLFQKGQVNDPTETIGGNFYPKICNQAIGTGIGNGLTTYTGTAGKALSTLGGSGSGSIPVASTAGFSASGSASIYTDHQWINFTYSSGGGGGTALTGIDWLSNNNTSEVYAGSPVQANQSTIIEGLYTKIFDPIFMNLEISGLPKDANGNPIQYVYNQKILLSEDVSTGIITGTTTGTLPAHSFAIGYLGDANANFHQLSAGWEICMSDTTGAGVYYFLPDSGTATSVTFTDQVELYGGTEDSQEYINNDWSGYVFFFSPKTSIGRSFPVAP